MIFRGYFIYIYTHISTYINICSYMYMYINTIYIYIRASLHCTHSSCHIFFMIPPGSPGLCQRVVGHRHPQVARSHWGGGFHGADFKTRGALEKTWWDFMVDLWWFSGEFLVFWWWIYVSFLVNFSIFFCLCAMIFSDIWQLYGFGSLKLPQLGAGGGAPGRSDDNHSNSAKEFFGSRNVRKTWEKTIPSTGLSCLSSSSLSILEIISCR